MTIQQDQWANLIEPIARELLGEPNRKLSNGSELRFGSRGSISVDLKKGTWFDFETNEGGGVIALIARETKSEPGEWLRARGYTNDPPPRKPTPSQPARKIAATFDYPDSDGTLLFQVVRYDPKDFRVRRPDPDKPGEWIWSTRGVKQVPYRLPEVLEALAQDRTVFIVEGEKCVDRLWSLGLPATCNAGGAGKWLDRLSQYFGQADVVIIPDYDPQKTTKTGELMFSKDGRPVLPGQDHAINVGRTLDGTAKRVRVLDLGKLWPNIKPKDDIFDWFEAGNTRETFDALVETAVDWSPKLELSYPGGARTNKDWDCQCMSGKSGLANNLANALIGLREDPELFQALAYDEMLRVPMLMRPLFRADPTFLPRPIEDTDVAVIQEFMQWKGLRKMGRDTMHQAVAARARENSFHPIRDYLNAVTPTWDRKERAPTWLSYYLGAVDSLYVRRIGKMFLISMVARIFEPGCQADYMPILEGPQGLLKSKACRVLGGKWFSDNLPDITSGKDVKQHLRGKWLIEVSELHAISKAEASQLKQFISRREECYRPSYGRLEVIEPRQCCFIGTTNMQTYLRDETGGRRFWPLETTNIKIEELERDRDQLFAEAVYCYRKGGEDNRWWPDKDFEREYIAPRQAARYESDAWEELVEEYLEPKETLTAENANVTLINIAVDVLGYEREPPNGVIPLPRRTPINQFGTANQRRVAAIMTKLGWRRAQKLNDKGEWVENRGPNGERLWEKKSDAP
jgi:Virulence-associated protein E